MIIFGGYLQTNLSQTQFMTNDVFSVDLNTYQLSKLAHEVDGRKPKSRKGHAACIMSNFLIVLGGKSDNNDYRLDLWIFVLKLQNEIGEKQGWSKIQILQHGSPVEEENDSEFTDLSHHTMTYIPSVFKSSEFAHSVDFID